MALDNQFYYFFDYLHQYISTAAVSIRVIMVDGAGDSDMEDLDVYAIEDIVADYAMVCIFVFSILYYFKIQLWN